MISDSIQLASLAQLQYWRDIFLSHQEKKSDTSHSFTCSVNSSIPNWLEVRMQLKLTVSCKPTKRDWWITITRGSYRYSGFCFTAANNQYWNFCIILMTNMQDLDIGGASHQQSTRVWGGQHDINQNIWNQTQRDCSDKDEVNANNLPHTREQNTAEYLTGSSSDI